MKKFLSIISSFLMVITMLPGFAISAFADEKLSLVGPNSSDHAYLDLHSNGEDYSFFFMGSKGDAALDGVSYNLETNTLTLDNYNEPGTIIEASEMGSDFKIFVIGENHIKAITVFADKYMGSLAIVGEGSISINENKDYDDIPLFLDANETSSTLVVEDSVKLSVCANYDDTSVKVLNSLNENPINCANTEYRISSWEESSTQAKWINAHDTQINTFFGIKDSKSYATYCWDEFSESNVYCEYVLVNRSVDGEEIVFAKPTMDDMGNPITIQDDAVDTSKTIMARQIMNKYERAAVEKENDGTEYTLTEYTENSEGPFWDVYKVMHDEELGDFFYPVSIKLTEKPTEYTSVIDTINNNFKYIEYDFTNFENVSYCEHKYNEGVVTKKPTCSTWGEKEVTCTICEEKCIINSDNYLDFEQNMWNGVFPLGHTMYNDLTETTITKQPTCSSLGECTWKCERCGEAQYDLIVKDLNNHNYKTTATVKATTSKDGKKVTKCSDCGNVKSTTAIKKVSNIKLSATKFTYDGKVKNPTLSVKDSAGKELVKGTDYTVTTPSGRKNVGKYTYKITFKGNYSGTKSLDFTIVPKSTSISSLKSSSKGFTVNWKKQATQTTGYEIQIAADSKFTKNVKSYTVAKNSTVSKKVTKLTGKKKYYVRIRAFKTVSSTKYYSAWSKSKTVTTKK